MFGVPVPEFPGYSTPLGVIGCSIRIEDDGEMREISAIDSEAGMATLRSEGLSTRELNTAGMTEVTPPVASEGTAVEEIPIGLEKRGCCI